MQHDEAFQSVRGGALPLATAQNPIGLNWIAAYRKYMRVDEQEKTARRGRGAATASGLVENVCAVSRGSLGEARQLKDHFSMTMIPGSHIPAPTWSSSDGDNSTRSR